MPCAPGMQHRHRVRGAHALRARHAAQAQGKGRACPMCQACGTDTALGARVPCAPGMRHRHRARSRCVRDLQTRHEEQARRKEYVPRVPGIRHERSVGIARKSPKVIPHTSLNSLSAGLGPPPTPPESASWCYWRVCGPLARGDFARNNSLALRLPVREWCAHRHVCSSSAFQPIQTFNNS